MQDVNVMLEEITRAVKEDDFDLSEWEDNFIYSIRDHINSGRTLSPKQDEVLERIWKKATGRS